MNICDNLGDHLVGNVYIKVRMHYNDYATCMHRITLLETVICGCQTACSLLKLADTNRVWFRQYDFMGGGSSRDFGYNFTKRTITLEWGRKRVCVCVCGGGVTV